MDRPRFSTLRVCSWRPACRECEGRARTCGASAAVCSRLRLSVSLRHFPPSLVLIPPALRVLWIWRHLRQRRDRSAAAAGGLVWGCVAAWRVCQTSKESAKMILTWILTHGFFQSLSERTIYKSSSTGQRQGGGAGCGTHRGYTRTACPGEAAPSSPAERKSSARSGAAARVVTAVLRFAGLLGCH